MLTRRNSFLVSPDLVERHQETVRRMTGESKRPPLAPTVSRGEAEIAAHLVENPVFVDVFNELRRVATARLCDSPLGPDGATEREAGRYELAALDAIENRIAAIAAEISLHPAADDLSAD